MLGDNYTCAPDFTWATALGITIGGEAFPHMLCHLMLPYSNWEWATVCQSESLAALRRGVQAALVRLGRSPQYHQTDNSTAATHDLRTGKRGFNAEYEVLVRHYGMTPRPIEVGEKHQNGDVESLNGALKRRLDQHLLLRGSRDFPTGEAYEAWLHECIEAANRLRTKRLEEEFAVMEVLPGTRLPGTGDAATCTGRNPARLAEHHRCSVARGRPTPAATRRSATPRPNSSRACSVTACCTVAG